VGHPTIFSNLNSITLLELRRFCPAPTALGGCWDRNPQRCRAGLTSVAPTALEDKARSYFFGFEFDSMIANGVEVKKDPPLHESNAQGWGTRPELNSTYFRSASR